MGKNDTFGPVTYFRRIAIFTSLVLLMGHMFTPHAHADAEYAEPCVHTEDEAHSLIDMIACFFRSDLGSDHLEEFTGAEDAQFPHIIASPNHLVLFVFGGETFSGCLTVGSRGAFVLPPSQRGPPVVA